MPPHSRHRHGNRTFLLLAALAVALVGIAWPSARADAVACPTSKTIFSTTATQGSTLSNVSMHPNVQLQQGTVTTLCDPSTGKATINGTITVGGDSTPVKVTVVYQDDKNWVLSISANAAGSGYTPPSWSSVNLNTVTGSITNANDALTFGLSASGYIMGSVKVTLGVSIDSTTKEWTGTYTIDNVHIGGLTINQATITATSTSKAATIDGSLSTNGGWFDATVSATGADYVSGSSNPQKWSLFIQLSSANLSGAVSTVTIKEWWANTTISSADATTCINVKFNAGGTFQIQNREYAVQEFSFNVQCNKLMDFSFSLIAEHKSKWNNQTVQSWYSMRWIKPSSTPVTVTTPWNDAMTIYGGFVGAADMSSVRHYHNVYEGEDFDRDVTVGIGLSSGMVAWTAGQSDLSPFVEMSGWVTADRVSGDITCQWQASPGTDSNCYVNLRLNPSWAGVYHYEWNWDI